MCVRECVFVCVLARSSVGGKEFRPAGGGETTRGCRVHSLALEGGASSVGGAGTEGWPQRGSNRLPGL